MQVSWSELRKAADEAGFSAVPAGEYDVVIDSCSPAESSSGKQMFKVKFEVESGPHTGAKVFSNFVLSPDSGVALGFFFRKMAALGLDSSYFDADPSVEQVARDLENRRCVAEVITREWNGQERNDVNTLKPPADGIFVRASGPDPGPGISVFGTSAPVSAPSDVPAAPATPTGMPF